MSFEVFKTHQPHSIADGNFVNVLGFEKHLYHGMVDYSFLINNDLFVSSVDNRSATHKECVVDEYVGEVIINRQLQGLVVQDNESCNLFHLLDCGDNVIVSHSTPFDNQGPSDDERFFASKWPDLRTSRFEDGGNDVSTLGASSNAYQD
ncbi:hypothetical protein PVK06_040174 [Gossypium arboreum]|uniref:Uncharacterized protein n=1 Tax=Gossypium arboreum TaxID=29729 RepID=A0ABR0N5I1_GOSAR|nr:hypothetical protein PVK06_040174 [Gossypium arboreum]